jgi:tungstate transport system substrate-binding protein
MCKVILTSVFLLAQVLRISPAPFIALLNIYRVMQVNPEKFKKVNGQGAKAYVEFVVTSDTRKMIGEFGNDKFGQPLFFPDPGNQM